MPHELLITPSGHLALVESSSTEAAAELSRPIVAAFAASPARGLLHLAANGLKTRRRGPLDYVRSFARPSRPRVYEPQAPEAKALAPTPPPSAEELGTWFLQAPPMTGLEYLRDEVLAGWWAELDALVRG